MLAGPHPKAELWAAATLSCPVLQLPPAYACLQVSSSDDKWRVCRGTSIAGKAFAMHCTAQSSQCARIQVLAVHAGHVAKGDSGEHQRTEAAAQVSYTRTL